MALVSCSFMKSTHPPSRSQNIHFTLKSPKYDAKKSKKVIFYFQVMKRLNIIYQEKFKVTRRKTLLKSHSLKQGKNTAKLQ